MSTRSAARAGALALLVLACSPCLAGSAAGPRAADWRAIWVTRFDYKTADDVRAIVARCAQAGFDRILFQVRGNGTAFYRSKLEPWAEELGGRDPGFDPLELACREARLRGVELHAWINVMPAWRGNTPPSDPAQLWNAQPGWLWYDQRGVRAPLLADFYASVNPCLPEVRAYLARVAAEVARYDVHGVHLDYIRFPNEAPVIPRGSKLDYPRDARTLSLYRAARDRAPEDDLEAWNAWRSDQVTELVRELRAAIRAARPTAVISAAVGSVPSIALGHFQDSERWLALGLLDAVLPMNYADDPALFGARVAEWRKRATGATTIVQGVRADAGESAVRRAQLEAVRGEPGGFALFGYHALFDSQNTVLARQDEAGRAERRARREALLPLVPRPWSPGSVR